MSTSTPSALELRDLEVRYGERRALSGVSLTVPEGQFVALAGPNGSGKTTLIRAALGFLAPSEGTVEVFGDALSTLTPRERALRVAWVPQDETPRDDVPLLDYVLYGRYAHQGMLEGESEEDRQLAYALLEEVGLADRAHDGVLSISGGERQRVVLARALAQEPRLLLLDEPTSHLDIGHQLDVLGRVRALARARSVTVVAAMHDLNLAARFSDRIVVLSRGRVVADGMPATVLSEAILRRVWGVAAELRKDPRSGTPFLIPYPLPTELPGAEAVSSLGIVHVIGGGGAASPYLRALHDAGIPLSAGALNLLDSDSETAEALGIPVVQELPFAPLGPEARARHRAFLAAARAIVVAPFAVGPSNVANLEDAIPYAREKPLWLVAEPPIGERDFSGGVARRRYAELLEAGAQEVRGTEELLKRLGASAPSSTRRDARSIGGKSPEPGNIQ